MAKCWSVLAVQCLYFCIGLQDDQRATVRRLRHGKVQGVGVCLNSDDADSMELALLLSLRVLFRWSVSPTTPRSSSPRSYREHSLGLVVNGISRSRCQILPAREDPGAPFCSVYGLYNAKFACIFSRNSAPSCSLRNLRTRNSRSGRQL